MARTYAGLKRKRSAKAGRTAPKSASRAMRAAAITTPVQAKFTRTFYSTNWAFNTASTAGFYRSFAPTFGENPNFAKYQALFDTFKVTGVKVTFLPKYGDTNVNANSTGAAPTSYNNQYYMTIGMDREYQEIPTGTYGQLAFDTLCQRSSSVKTYKLDKPFSIFYKPNILNQATLSDVVVPCPWMSMRLGTQPLLGFLAFFHDANFAALNQNTTSVDIMYTYYFQCKGTR